MGRSPENRSKTYLLGAFRATSTPILQQAADELGLPIEIGEDYKIPVRSRSVVNGIDYVDVPQGSVFVAVKISPKTCSVTGKLCDRTTYSFLERVIDLSLTQK